MVQPRFKSNGKTSDKTLTLADKLAARRPGTDEVSIGSRLPVPEESSEPVRTASMASVMELVAGVSWLVRGWVPFGMLTELVAEPGIGKSAFALFCLARPIILPTTWFNSMKGPSSPGCVLWCDTEGSAAITVQRMRDWALPAERILVPFKDDPLRAINLRDAEHLERVEQVINCYKIPLVVVDALRGAHSDDENSSRVAQVLQPLASIAERTKAAIVIVHHARKIGHDEELSANCSRGSNAILALVRSQIGIDRPDPESKWCRVRVLKENLGIAPRPIGFQVTDHGLEFGPAPERPKQSRSPARDEAKAWLADFLKDGPRAAGEIWAEVEADGMCKATVKTAKRELGVETKRIGGKDGAWHWSLPAKKGDS